MLRRTSSQARKPQPHSDFRLGDILIGTAVILAAVFINRFGLYGNVVFFAVVAILATRSCKSAFQALSLGLMALVTNNAIVIKSIVWSFGRFGLTVGLSGRFLFNDLPAIRGSLMRDVRYQCVCLFAVAVAITSVLAGNRPDLALMKDFSFWLGLSGFFAAAFVLRHKRYDATPWMMKIVCASCCICWIAYAMGIGKNFKGTPGQEIGLYNLGFYHSQTLGPSSALMLLYVISVFLFTKYRNRWICIPLALSLLVAIRMSGSRTGALTLLSGLFVLLMCTLWWTRGRRFTLRKNVSRFAIIAIAALAITGGFIYDWSSGNALTKSALSFLAKKSGQTVESVTLDEATSSRRGLIDRSLNHFRESPIFGNGFQLYADREHMADKTFLSAQIEKGFLPTAILEETGIIGAAFLVLLIFSFLTHWVRERNIPGLSLFVAMLFMNLGECSFFSMGGQGAYAWLFVTAGDLLGDQCKIMHSPVTQPRACAGTSRLALTSPASASDGVFL